MKLGAFGYVEGGSSATVRESVVNGALESRRDAMSIVTST